MPIEKEPLNKYSKEVLFQDKYGILQLAAHATLARTPRPFKRIQAQWINSMLTAIRRWWENNNIIFFAFVWLDPFDFMHEVICQKRLQDAVKI